MQQHVESKQGAPEIIGVVTSPSLFSLDMYYFEDGKKKRVVVQLDGISRSLGESGLETALRCVLAERSAPVIEDHSESVSNSDPRSV